MSFTTAHEFAWHDAALFDRTCAQDGERRYAAIGLLQGKLHTVIFTKRGKGVRIISLRRANKSEETAYEKSR